MRFVGPEPGEQNGHHVDAKAPNICHPKLTGRTRQQHFRLNLYQTRGLNFRRSSRLINTSNSARHMVITPGKCACIVFLEKHFPQQWCDEPFFLKPALRKLRWDCPFRFQIARVEIVLRNLFCLKSHLLDKALRLLLLLETTFTQPGLR